MSWCEGKEKERGKEGKRHSQVKWRPHGRKKVIAAAFQKFSIWLERYTAAEMNQRKQTSLGQFKVKCLKTVGLVGRTTDCPGEGRLSLRDGRPFREWDSHTQWKEASVHIHDGSEGLRVGHEICSSTLAESSISQGAYHKCRSHILGNLSVGS